MVCVSNLFSFAFDGELKTLFKILIFNLASLPKDICININMATIIKIKEIKQTAPDVLSVSGVCYTIYGPINIDTEVVLIES